jgi:hypothetical protein
MAGRLSLLGAGRQTFGADTWWDLSGTIASCVAAYQAKGAADYAASKVNLVNASLYGLSAPTADPTFDTSYGWAFTKALKNYLVPAGLIPNANATWSMIVRFSDGNAQMGCVSTTYFNFFLNTASVEIGHGSWAGKVTNAPATTSGVYGLAGRIGYRDGVADANQASGINSTSNWIMGIGGLTMHGGYNDCMSGKIQACAFYNATLTAPQMAALTLAMAAL